MFLNKIKIKLLYVIVKNGFRRGKCYFEGCVLKYLGERIYLLSIDRKF